MTSPSPTETEDAAASAADLLDASATAVDVSRRMVPAADAVVRPLFEAGFLMSRGDVELQSARAALEADSAQRRIDDDARRAELETRFEDRVAALERDAAAARSAAEQASANAFEAARLEGLEQGRSELAHAAAQVTRAVEQFRADCAVSIERGAVALCGLLLERELGLHPERIVEVVAYVWHRARGRHTACIRVHAAQVDAVRAALDSLRDQAPESADITVVADHDIAPHGVAIETAAGTCRFSLESWLRELRVHLEGVDRQERA